MFDFSSILNIVFVAVAGGIIGLDRTAAGQFMISQPLVAAPAIGLLLGDAVSGLVIGAALELVWVLDIPVGKFVPADATICAVSATAIAILGSAGIPSLSMIGVSIFMTLVLVPLTMQSDILVRTRNSRFYDDVWNATGDRVGKELMKAQMKGLSLFFLKSFVLYCLFIPAGMALLAVAAKMPLPGERAFALFVRLLPLLGVAMIIRRLSMRTLNAHVLAAFICGAALLPAVTLIPTLAALTIAATAGWYGGKLFERTN